MAVTLTESACSQIRQIMESENKPDALVRMYIIGGGCAGLQYHMAWDDEFDPNLDARYDQDGVSLVTTKKFALHLDGTTVDFHDGPTGGFTVENPNYPNTGGCPGCHGG
jgi:iron-sulfur cluster assembly accessory protein